MNRLFLICAGLLVGFFCVVAITDQIAEIVDGVVAQELPIPDEPEAVDSEATPRENISSSTTNLKPAIKIPGTLKIYEHVPAELHDISLDDVAKGRVTLEIYPKDKVTVFSNISFVTRKPEIILFPREAGNFWLVFVLHTGSEYTFIDVPFTVVGSVVSESTPEKSDILSQEGQVNDDSLFRDSSFRQLPVENYSPAKSS